MSGSSDEVGAMSLVKRISVAIIKTFGFIALLVFIYGQWVRWDVRGVTKLCSDIHPGISIAGLPDLFETHGFDRELANTRMKSITVAAQSTMGEYVCVIDHNNGVVTSVNMLGD